MADTTKATLKKALDRAKGVEAGTVLRFEVCFENDLLRDETSKRYQYAALYVAGRWWLTGERGIDGNRSYTYEELLRLLATDKRVENVEVASGFESLA